MGKLPAIPYFIHKASAYPFIICWIIGTLGFWIPLSFTSMGDGTLASLSDDWSTIPLLLLCYAATCGLGFFAGTFLVSWMVLPLCRRFNGAPHEVGDEVIVLSGPHSGTSAFIHTIVIGQGGQPLPRVDLGVEARDGFSDLFEEYELLRVSTSRRSQIPPAT